VYIIAEAIAMQELTYPANYVYIAFGVVALFLTMIAVYDRFFSVCIRTLKEGHAVGNLLLDVRGGTGTFHIERRRFPRVKTKGPVTARLSGRNSSAPLTIINVSYAGAFVATDLCLQPNETLDMDIYFPFFPQPASVRARVIWARKEITTDNTAPSFKARMEFLNLDRIDMHKLAQTVNFLIESQQA
jgi:hypothetical protein